MAALFSVRVETLWTELMREPRFRETAGELKLRDQYEAGATISELAIKYHRDKVTIREALHFVGTTMRPPGRRGQVGSKSTRPDRVRSSTVGGPRAGSGCKPGTKPGEGMKPNPFAEYNAARKAGKNIAAGKLKAGMKIPAGDVDLEGGLLPLGYMLRVLRRTNTPASIKRWAASAAAPYMHPKLSSVEHGGEVTLKHEDALDQLDLGQPEQPGRDTGQSIRKH